ncbi:hypothetical protein [Arthrobacter sp. Z1-15]
MNFTIRRSINALGAAGLLVIGAAAVGLIREPAPQPAPESADAGAGSLLFGGITEAPSGEASAADRAQREKLDALRGTQSAEELQELATSPAPAVLLYDPATREYLAGYELPAP